jgi:anti-anti-sigma factor
MPMVAEIYGEVAVARLEDELTEDNLGRFDAMVERPLEEGVHNVVIDMEKTEYIDNAGLESLENLRDRLEALGGHLKYSGLGLTCRKIFEMTRFDQRIEVFDNMLDAVRSFQ